MTVDSEDAARALRELDGIAERARSESRSMATGLPLIGWGIAWIVGLGAIDVLTGIPRLIVVVIAWVIAMALSWVPSRRTVKHATDARVRWAWTIVFAASPLLILAADPRSVANGVLLLGALWGLAMCVYAVATGDIAFAIASGVSIVAAGALAALASPPSMLWYGLLGGIALLALGLHRALGGTRHG